MNFGYEPKVFNPRWTGSPEQYASLMPVPFLLSLDYDHGQIINGGQRRLTIPFGL